MARPIDGAAGHKPPAARVSGFPPEHPSADLRTPCFAGSRRHAVCPGRSTADRRPCPPATQGLCPWSAHTSRRGDWRTMEVQPLRSCGGRYAFPQRLPLPPLRPCGRGDICLEDGNPCPSRRYPLPGVITLRRTATITPGRTSSPPGRPLPGSPREASGVTLIFTCEASGRCPSGASWEEA